MDALKFFKERMRMCNYYSRSLECPRAIEEMSDEELEDFVNTVEQWGKEHPQRTRLQDFMEKYPNAEVYPDGQPVICCARLGYREYCRKSLDDNHEGFKEGFKACFNCWNMPVEDE